MSGFSKPRVGVSFSGAGDAAEPVVEPLPTLWAHNPARRVAVAVVLALLCVAAYAAPIADGGYLPADQQSVIANPAVYHLIGFYPDTWFGFRAIWGAPQHLQQVSPIAYTVMLVEHQYFRNARGYRVISLFIHIANFLLLLRLLNRLELPGAWLAAALFALHPVQVDAVSWISQQRYLICGFFYLSALLIYLRRAGLNPAPPPPLPGTEPLIRIALPERSWLLYALSFTLFLFAVLSHVAAVTFPLVVLIMIWWERGTVTWSDVRPLIAPAIVSTAFVILLVTLNISQHGQLWTTAIGWRWLVLAPRGLWSAATLLALPISLSYAHPRWDQSPIAAWQWVFPIAVVFVIVALWRLRQRWGRGPLACVLLFAGLLLPVAFGANDPGDLPGIVLQEHQLYLACAALFTGIAVLVVDFVLSRPTYANVVVLPGVAPAIALVVAASLTVMTAFHSAAYADEKSAWTQALSSDGDSVVALNQLGSLEMNDKEYGKAESHFQAALSADPSKSDALFHLASVAEAQGDYGRANGLYLLILHDHPDDATAHFGLAQSYVSQGQVQSGLQEYDKVLALRPRDADVYNNLGLIYARQGEPDRAIAAYQKAADLDPKMAAPYLNMANVQFQAGRFKDARVSLESAIKIDPHNYIVWMNAGVMATTVGDLENGEKYFRAAMFYNPNSADACVDYGMVLMRESALPGKKSRVNEAIGYFKRATVLDPKNKNAQAGLAESEKRRDAETRQQER